MKSPKISNNVIRRLPRYIRYLERLEAAGTAKVSSSEISEATGFTASQIRQDFNCFGGFGQQGYGYNVPLLRQRLCEVLDIRNGHTAVVIGAGNLGRALMGNFKFGKFGFTVTAAFDSAADKIGSSVAGVPVLDISGLEEYLSANDTDVAVLTLPGKFANDMGARISAAGVPGIWNFTNEEITTASDGTVIENVHFSDSLLALSYFISKNKQ